MSVRSKRHSRPPSRFVEEEPSQKTTTDIGEEDLNLFMTFAKALPQASSEASTAVRAIPTVATAVTQGPFPQHFTYSAPYTSYSRSFPPTIRSAASTPITPSTPSSALSPMSCTLSTPHHESPAASVTSEFKSPMGDSSMSPSIQSIAHGSHRCPPVKLPPVSLPHSEPPQLRYISSHRATSVPVVLATAVPISSGKVAPVLATAISPPFKFSADSAGSQIISSLREKRLHHEIMEAIPRPDITEAVEAIDIPLDVMQGSPLLKKAKLAHIQGIRLNQNHFPIRATANSGK